ncbi:hypothetical protein NL518_27615, partial [Klebsiella pneumoniae]|nr:hypothetical protein [Klebsiella pneumoniae]
MDEAVNYGGDWDFAGTWSLVNGSRPVLQWEYQGSNVITSLNQLRLINTDLNGVYILGADIDLAGVWNPLGSANNPFTGILKGRGYTLSGLNIENSS